MKRTKKKRIRILAAAICLVLLLAGTPATALADGASDWDEVSFEAQNNYRIFGIGRTVAALDQAMDEAPQRILENVHRAVDAFAAGAPQFDDLTMMCLQYNGMPATPAEKA